MHNIASNNNNKADWQYFPNTYRLSLYLPHSDILQLGLTCKYFRLKLESKIFSKLELLHGNEFIPGRPNKLGKKKQLVILADVLEDEYQDRYRIVSHCIFWKSINSKFARDFFNLFTNITQLELHSEYKNARRYSYYIEKPVVGNIMLIEALYPLKNLKFLTMSSNLIDSEQGCSKRYLKLPSCLNTLDIIECKIINQVYFEFYPIENINEEYSSLKKVSIISDEMLSNMVTRMKSLVDVTIFSNPFFTKSNLVQFLLLNPQLEKLTVPEYFLDRELINIMFKMKQLKHLNINESCSYDSCEIDNIPINTSIEHLNLSCHVDNENLIEILNNLKSLKVLEYSNNNFYNFSPIDPSEYKIRIPLLHLNNLCNLKPYIFYFKFSEIFDKVRFTNMFELNEYLYGQYNSNDLYDWKVCHQDPADTKEFTLAKNTYKYQYF
jgi:hypothetical protein